ncbi:MAG: hypothetical protein JW838_07045 [Spirochaetes bacterium]|nr:hypothetical protein [Spirochaetota bacterium]
MKKRVFIAVVLLSALYIAAGSPLHGKTPSPAAKKASDLSEGSGEVYDSGILNRIRDDRNGEGPRVGPKNRDEEPPVESFPEERESARKRRKPVAFKMGFSLGAVGLGILGPRSAFTNLYRYRFVEGSFNVGFRGGMEAFLVVRKLHYLSLGLFFEQRKIQVKVAEVGFLRVMLYSLPLEVVYCLPLTKYVDKSTVDTNYISIPVAYRFFFYQDFYLGLGLDVAVLLQAKANYGMIFYSSSVNMRPELSPVDFGGRLIFGVVMNRVLVEIGLGTGFLDYDRMGGERHSIYFMGMIGYLI